MTIIMESCVDSQHENLTLQSHYPNYSFETFINHAKSELFTKNRVSQCYKDLSKITISVNDPTPETLAFKLKSAWGQPPSTLSGYSGGNFFAEGDRFSCYEASNSEILTTYCRTNYKILNPFALIRYKNNPTGERWKLNRYWMQGVCIPESCANEPVLTSLVGKGYKDNFFPEDFVYDNGRDIVCDLEPFLTCEKSTTWVERCDKNGSECWIGFSCVLSLILMVGISSLILLMKRSQKFSFFRFFAIQSTWSDLTNFKRNPKQLESLNSMRVLALIWVIALHIAGQIIEPLWNGTWYADNLLSFGKKVASTFGYNMAIHGEAAVDTFFVMGGFLASQILYKKILNMEKQAGDKFKNSFVIQFCYCLNLLIHRWLRFLPVICMLVWMSYISPIWGDSFKDEIVRQYSETCKIETSVGWNGEPPGIRQVKNSWLGLVFMFQTWTDKAGLGCAGWMWYVVDEFWFYFLLLGITFLVRFLERKNNSKLPVFVIYGFFIAFSPLYKTAVNIYCGPYEADGTRAPHCNDLLGNLYFMPWCRCSAYFQGALIGFLLKDKRYFIKLKKTWQFFVYFSCWIGVALFICIFIWLQKKCDEWGYGSTGFIIYDSWKHEIWAAVIVIPIILCEYVEKFSNNFPVWFLKGRFWFFPSRINYATYGVHYYIIAAVISMYPKVVNLTYNFWWQDLVITTLVSYFVGFLVFVIAESPFSKLVERFFNRPCKKLILKLCQK